MERLVVLSDYVITHILPAGKVIHIGITAWFTTNTQGDEDGVLRVPGVSSILEGQNVEDGLNQALENAQRRATELAKTRVCWRDAATEEVIRHLVQPQAQTLAKTHEALSLEKQADLHLQRRVTDLCITLGWPPLSVENNWSVAETVALVHALTSLCTKLTKIGE